LISTAEINLFDKHRIDFRPLKDFFDHDGGQIVWPHVF
jgi:hypothetical protein